MSDIETPEAISVTEWNKEYSTEIFDFLIRVYGFERALKIIDIRSITDKSIQIISQVLSDSYDTLVERVTEIEAALKADSKLHPTDPFLRERSYKRPPLPTKTEPLHGYNFDSFIGDFLTHISLHGVQKTLATLPFSNIEEMEHKEIKIICRTILFNQESLSDLLLDQLMRMKR